MTKVTFGTDRKVLLPDVILDNPQGIETGLLANAAFKSAYEFFYANEDKFILVAGHTDPSGSQSHNDELSTERAISVLLYLAGDRVSWARHGFSMHSPDDIQTVLLWAFVEFGYDSKIEDFNSNLFRDSDKEALKGFRKGFFQQFGSILYELQDLDIGEPSEVDFAAFYHLYDFKLAETMDISQEKLQIKKDGLKFYDPAGIGCGENFPIDFIDLKGAEEDRQNRRVDILFFDEGEEVDLNTSPPAKAIYADGLFELHSVKVGDGELNTSELKKCHLAYIFENELGEPIQDTDISIHINGDLFLSKTDINGQILVEGLEPDEYFIRIGDDEFFLPAFEDSEPAKFTEITEEL